MSLGMMPYIEAICDAANSDTYGKRYDSRVVGDVTTLNLDAYAEPVEIAEILQADYTSQYIHSINPYIDLLDGLYTELRDEKLKTVRWNQFDAEMFTEIVYVEDSPGATTLEAVVLTENDIVFDVTKELTVYTSADGAQICNEAGEGISSAMLSVSESKSLAAALFYSGGIPEVGELGTVYSRAFTDTDVVTVSGTDLESCVIPGRNAGSAYISMTVETRASNTYTCRIPVTVN